MLAATPSAAPVEVKNGDNSGPFVKWFSQSLTKLLRWELLKRNLSSLVSDTSDSLNRILELNGNKETGMVDPFDHIFKIVYQLTMRQLGPTEIANDQKMLDKTLHMFIEIERGSSPMRIIFPWLPTVGWLRQMIAGARMYSVFRKIAERRKAEERKEDDAFQVIMDTGADVMSVTAVSLTLSSPQ